MDKIVYSNNSPINTYLKVLSLSGVKTIVGEDAFLDITNPGLDVSA